MSLRKLYLVFLLLVSLVLLAIILTSCYSKVQHGFVVYVEHVPESSGFHMETDEHWNWNVKLDDGGNVTGRSYCLMQKESVVCVQYKHLLEIWKVVPCT